MADRHSTRVRLPKALHERLWDLAVEQDISLNSLIITLLAGSVGFTLAETPEDK
jgi:predicted HicB family RNase H-like nuclease